MKRKVCSLLNIMDTIMSLGSFQYTIICIIYLNMDSYVMQMDEMTEKMCTIVLQHLNQV